MFVENNRDCLEIIRHNAQFLGVKDAVEIRRADVLEYLREPDLADIYFADPPYEFNRDEELLNLFVKLPKETLIVLESRKDYIPARIMQEKVLSQARYGDTIIYFFEI